MALHIKTIEHLEGDYGLHTWPCAPVLAQFVYSQRDVIKGKKVLELGAGTAVPGLVAGKCGAHVTLSDREATPRLLDNLRKSCDLNGLTVLDQKVGSNSFNKATNGVKIMAISWGVFSPEVISLDPQDIILASDCFYDTKDFEDVLATVAYLMEKNPSCKFWTTYQERNSNRSLLPLLDRWGLQCRPIPLETFYVPTHSSSTPGEEVEGKKTCKSAATPMEDSVIIEGLSENIIDSSHTIHMWEITKTQSTQYRSL